MAKTPEDLKYTKSHEWVRLNGEIATIGITDHAQSELGDVVYVELPAVGKTLEKGQSFGSVESVKTVSDVYAPVAGEVIETNSLLATGSEILNTDPYEMGWMLKLKTDGTLPDGLLSAEEYAAETA